MRTYAPWSSIQNNYEKKKDLPKLYLTDIKEKDNHLYAKVCPVYLQVDCTTGPRKLCLVQGHCIIRLMRGKNQFPIRPTVCVGSLYVLMSAKDFSGSFGFPPYPKDVCIVELMLLNCPSLSVVVCERSPWKGTLSKAGSCLARGVARTTFSHP